MKNAMSLECVLGTLNVFYQRRLSCIFNEWPVMWLVIVSTLEDVNNLVGLTFLLNVCSGLGIPSSV